MTLNSVELGRTDLPEDGRIQLELPEDVIRRLSNGFLSLRLTVVPCPPGEACGAGTTRIAGIRIEHVH